VLVALGKQYADSKDSSEASTHLFWFDKVVAFRGQYLTKSLGTSDQQPLHIEHMAKKR
jgi:hypothetical protein